MKRRNFLEIAGAGMVGAALIPEHVIGLTKPGKTIKWMKTSGSNLFGQVIGEGQNFVRSSSASVLDAFCIIADDTKGKSALNLKPGSESAEQFALKANLRHRLHQSGKTPGEDLLEATLVLRNTGSAIKNIDVKFISSTHASDQFTAQQLYIPISAAGLFKDDRHASIGSLEFLTDCDNKVGKDAFACHYLEPMASNPSVRKTKALLLAPVIDSYYPGTPWRVAMFTESSQACEFSQITNEQKIPTWSTQQRITLKAGEERVMRCFLHIHQEDSGVAWKAFHRYGHHELAEVPEWLREVKVHYYDFLSSAHGKEGHRGDGYEADLAYFKQYRVGMATQHGYYPSIGDFLQPDRPSWQAMRGDKNGSVEMSIKKMKERIAATRAVGTRPAVYMHTLCFDDASPLFGKLKDSIMVNEQGKPIPYPWSNVDTAGSNWFMSFAAKDWRDHLLKQTEYIMEILHPDAIVFDETFLCLGYDEHPDRKGPLSTRSIPYMREMRDLIHSYGKDKALLTSDCSMAGMVLWADGEAGDHSYPNLLGNPLYRKMPIRFQAPLCSKPWIPCSWHFIQMWEPQMDLARKIKTGVGVANGYIEFNGLKGLPTDVATAIKNDIQSLF
jgi:hypothetical protein